MHYYIYSSKSTYISELTSSRNFGGDQILELEKNMNHDLSEVKGVNRILTQFDLTEVSKSYITDEINDPRFYLRLYETEGNKEMTPSYTLSAYPLSQSWEEGTGDKFADPVIQDGATWSHRDYRYTNVSWSGDFATTNEGSGITTGSRPEAGGGAWYTGSGYMASQSFSYESPDINMDVTDIVNKWLDGTIQNNGFIISFSGSEGTGQEVNSGSAANYGQMKFFSNNTHTIYPPKLEMKWKNHAPSTGSNTGSLSELDVSGNSDNYLYMKGLRDSYKETETVRFNVGARKRYVQKTFSTSVNELSASFIAEGSSSYSIIDLATGETVIPFKDIVDNTYTQLGCDSTNGMYFIQDMNTFQPNRFYKIIYKLKYNDGQEQIFDDNFEFKVVR
tara:strand:+ start:695 stop:1864 length:1170 start_codon:yes stop_codon:yes gene_type:complete